MFSPLILSSIVFGIAALAIVTVIAGSRLAQLADQLADRTGLGEARRMASVASCSKVR